MEAPKALEALTRVIRDDWHQIGSRYRLLLERRGCLCRHHVLARREAKRRESQHPFVRLAKLAERLNIHGVQATATYRRSSAAQGVMSARVSTRWNGLRECLSRAGARFLKSGDRTV